MGYSGFLIKVGSYTIDQGKFIKAESYNVTRNVQDIDSYRDSDGKLHRNALDHDAMKVEFETPALLNSDDMEAFMGSIRGQYINAKERKLSVTCYVPELGDYVTQDMYMPDPKFTMYSTHTGKIQYLPTRFAFIGY